VVALSDCRALCTQRALNGLKTVVVIWWVPTAIGAVDQSRSDSGLAQRGHLPRRWWVVRIADHSAFSLRRSSACRRSLGCRAWTVQAVPSSSPRQTSRTAFSIIRVTVHCGVLRHDVSLPGRGPTAGFRGSASRSSEMST
jgi:hypothetical protein